MTPLPGAGGPAAAGRDGAVLEKQPVGVKRPRVLLIMGGGCGEGDEERLGRLSP